MNDACFALLDDCHASAKQPTSRLYQDFAHEHRCTQPSQLDALWAQVEADLRHGMQAVVLIDYEWGAKLLQAGHAQLAADDTAALRVLMFRSLSRLSAEQVTDWLGAQHDAAGLMSLTATVTPVEFEHAITTIQAAIAEGATYQVNYTYRLQAEVFGEPVALYQQLRARQPVAFGAFIILPKSETGVDVVLSCSPELFLRNTQGQLTARPMKGTAPRSADPAQNAATAQRLAADSKNRAENLMIVDLLRNDLGRIAQTGSVTVPELFAVEAYGDVLQMSSTVQAQLQPGVTFPDVLRAAFPCGSITGAPKHHTMGLIAQLEGTPRGLYCGAIGWVDAPQQNATCPDFCLSVAIRTLTLGAVHQGKRPALFGVGAGIVADSNAADELAECQLKARVLTGLDPGFELFETLLATPGNQATRERIPLLDRHLQRLAHSAQVLGFEFDRTQALHQLAAAELPPDRACRLRLSLRHNGHLQLIWTLLAPMSEEPVTLLIAEQRLPNKNPLSAHKTTLRHAYDQGVKAAEQAGAFDSLFFTQDGRLVEGGRSSVFIKTAEGWLTPPIADGALPGVMRGELLQSANWTVSERSLWLNDLQNAHQIMVCNALRGMLPARLARSN
jgi:para-aminobenzoate synthetase / 4-amino-4-deoxychorismate lyase